jgi:hypothetical protein
MPCNTSRANHKLLRKDCPSGCNCCVNTAYSCQPICCKEENNQQFTANQVAQLYCEFFEKLSLENFEFGTTTSFILDVLCQLSNTLSFPCPVTFSINSVLEGSVPEGNTILGTVKDGICTPAENVVVFGGFQLVIENIECKLGIAVL